MHNFTSHDLLLYIFNETTSDTNIAIEKAIESDIHFRNEYQTLQQTIFDIDHISLTPNDRILENIISSFRHEKDVQIV